MMLKYRFKILIPHIKTQTRKQIYGDLLTDINTKQERIVQNKHTTKALHQNDNRKGWQTW